MHNNKHTYRQLIKKLEEGAKLSQDQQGYQDLWEASSHFEYPQTGMSNEDAWLQIRDRLNTEQNIPKRNTTFFLKIAASLFIIWGLAWFTYYQWTSNQSQAWVLQTGPGERITYELNEGTQITLNGNTRLTISGQSLSDQRTVSIEGEAFFKVTEGPNASNGHNPFVVRYKTVEIKVLGTEFKVNTYADSTIQVAVSKGKVKIQNQGQWVNTLSGGHTMEYQLNPNRYHISALRNPDQIQNLQVLHAENMKAEAILNQIKYVSGVTLRIPQSYRDVHVTTTLPLNDPQQAASILSKTLGIEIQVE